MDLDSKYVYRLGLERLLIRTGAKSLAATAAMVSEAVDLSYIGVYELWNQKIGSFIYM